MLVSKTKLLAGLVATEEMPITYISMPLDTVYPASLTEQLIKNNAVTAAKINVIGLDGTTGRIIVADVTDANAVTGGINSYASTLIEPGKVVISGSTNLSNWRHGTDTTKIDGGNLYTGSVTAAQILVSGSTMLSDWRHGSDATKIDGGDIYTKSVTATQIAASTITTTELNFTPYVIGTNTLDNVADGSTYSKVLSTHLSAGKIQLISTTVVDGGFTTDKIGQGSTNLYFNGKTLDDLGNGTTYHRVLATQISAGNIELTSTGFKLNQDGVIGGTVNGTRVVLDAAYIAGYSDATTKQFYLQASDGEAYFGGGVCNLDATGLHLTGNANLIDWSYDGNTAYINFAGSTAGQLWLYSTVEIYLSGANIGLYAPTGGVTFYSALKFTGAGGLGSDMLLSASTHDIGSSTTYLAELWAKNICLAETTTPTATTNFGKIYTKTDDKLYFQDGAGNEHELAFV